MTLGLGEAVLREANPLVTLHVGPADTGHNVALRGAGKQLVEKLLLEALLDASGHCA